MYNNLKHMKKNYKFRSGFTLIELLVVITVIGLLSGMILVGLSGVRSQGRDTRRVADLHNVQNALEIYFNKRGEYPPTSNWDILEDAMREANTGVSKLPRDPLNNGSNIYRYSTGSTGGMHYVLSATLENFDSQLLEDDVDDPLFVTDLDCADGSTIGIYCVEL